jgi:hypothetical protein
VRKDLRGPLRAHPALVELRAQRAVYVRLIGRWELPAGVVGDVEAPAPRRKRVPALRGVSGGVA